MNRRRLIALLGLGLLGYLLAWPVPLQPVSWDPSPDPGYTGAYAANDRLAAVQRIPFPGHGPEDVAIRDNQLYASASDGRILRVDSAVHPFADTGGRPLGLEFGPDGTLWVADAYRGLLRVDPQGQVELVCDTADGVPIRYADDVDVTATGQVYFTDASTRFGAKAWGDTLLASKLAILEHSGDGRLLVYEPGAGCRTVQAGLNFPNGVAIAADGSFVALVETATYRVLRYWLSGPRAGQTDSLIEGLPGFPDNIARAPDGGFWIGLISPRSGPVDATAGWPFVRKMLWRLPAAIQPDAKRYAHVIKVTPDGTVVANLQDPAGGYPYVTGAVEHGGRLYLTSLRTPALGYLPWP